MPWALGKKNGKKRRTIGPAGGCGQEASCETQKGRKDAQRSVPALRCNTEAQSPPGKKSRDPLGDGGIQKKKMGEKAVY